jgi:hypothetical protein
MFIFVGGSHYLSVVWKVCRTLNTFYFYLCYSVTSRCSGGDGSSFEVAFQNGLRLTVDFFRESWPYCRLWFQKLTNCRQSRFQKKNRNCCNLKVDSRFFVDFAVHFPISVGKWNNSYKMASNSSKFSVEVNSRLRGRTEILQQFTFWPTANCRLFFKKSNDCRQLVTFKKKSRNSRFIVKSRLSTCTVNCRLNQMVIATLGTLGGLN